MSEAEGSLVVFTPSGKRGRFDEGTNLLDAARALGVDLDSVCGGRGICGRCQVVVSEGEFAKHGITSKADHLTVGFWGLLRVAEALGIGSPTSRVIAAAAFALSPRALTTLGAISSETLPMMLAPWVLLPVILALRGQGPVRVLAARSALAVALMGAVNAVATLTGCLAALIWWACHRPNRLWWRFTRGGRSALFWPSLGGWWRWCCWAGSARPSWTSSNPRASPRNGCR